MQHYHRTEWTDQKTDAYHHPFPRRLSVSSLLELFSGWKPRSGLQGPSYFVIGKELPACAVCPWVCQRAFLLDILFSHVCFAHLCCNVVDPKVAKARPCSLPVWIWVLYCLVFIKVWYWRTSWQLFSLCIELHVWKRPKPSMHVCIDTVHISAFFVQENVQLHLHLQHCSECISCTNIETRTHKHTHTKITSPYTT